MSVRWQPGLLVHGRRLLPVAAASARPQPCSARGRLQGVVVLRGVHGQQCAGDRPVPGPPPGVGSACAELALVRGRAQIPVIKREKALEVGLQTLRQAGVEGVMVDVWWGIVESAGPGQYGLLRLQAPLPQGAPPPLAVPPPAPLVRAQAAGGGTSRSCDGSAFLRCPCAWAWLVVHDAEERSSGDAQCPACV